MQKTFHCNFATTDKSGSPSHSVNDQPVSRQEFREVKNELHRLQNQRNFQQRNNRTRDGRPICNNCHKPGHIASRCYRNTANVAGQNSPYTAPARESLGPRNQYYDSARSNHAEFTRTVESPNPTSFAARNGSLNARFPPPAPPPPPLSVLQASNDISHKYKFARCRPLREQIECTDPETSQTNMHILNMRKIFKDEVPIPISDLFQLSVNEQYNLRSNCTMLKLVKPRTNTLKRSFSYHAAKTWNKLPTDLKNLSISDKVFKHNLEDFINENPSFLSNFHGQIFRTCARS